MHETTTNRASLTLILQKRLRNLNRNPRQVKTTHHLWWYFLLLPFDGNSKTDWTVIRRHNTEYKPQAALTTQKTPPFHLPSDSSDSFTDLFRSHFIPLVWTAHFALCMSSMLLSSVLHLWSISPNMFQAPGVCVSHSSFLHSLCLADKMLDAHFPVMMMTAMMMMTTIMEKHLAMPFLHSLPSLHTHYSNETAQELLDAAAKCHFYLPATSDTVDYFLHQGRSAFLDFCDCVFLVFLLSLWTFKFSYLLGIPI